MSTAKRTGKPAKTAVGKITTGKTVAPKTLDNRAVKMEKSEISDISAKNGFMAGKIFNDFGQR
ncbi:MAG: hypothetical protein LBS09_08745 [Bacteroidales bacterium]|jgi:hypothetical protein|nr:hypothetical protein [Bacteroidales bacterium]